MVELPRGGNHLLRSVQPFFSAFTSLFLPISLFLVLLSLLASNNHEHYGGARSIFARPLRLVGYRSRPRREYATTNGGTSERDERTLFVIRALNGRLFEALISAAGKEITRKTARLQRANRFSPSALADRSFYNFLVPFPSSLYTRRARFLPWSVSSYFSSLWEATIIIALRRPYSVLCTALVAAY